MTDTVPPDLDSPPPRTKARGRPRQAKLPRTRLDSIDRVRREMTQVYISAKHGWRDVQDASRLANILSLIARLIEGGDLEQRLECLERQVQERDL